jgi:hypothetical protein
LLGFMKAARAVFARLTATPAAAKRQAQGKGAPGGKALIRRSDLNRALKQQAKLARLKYRARKIEPKRPGDPDETGLGLS